MAPPPHEGSKLTLRYRLVEAMRFFGYADGGVPAIELGTVRLDESGRFSIDLADLSADSFLDADRDVWVHVRSAEGEQLGTYRVGLSALYSEDLVVLDEPL